MAASGLDSWGTKPLRVAHQEDLGTTLHRSQRGPPEHEPDAGHAVTRHPVHRAVEWGCAALFHDLSQRVGRLIHLPIDIALGTRYRHEPVKIGMYQAQDQPARPAFATRLFGGSLAEHQLSDPQSQTLTPYAP